MTYLPPLSLVSSSHQIIATQEWFSTMTEDLARPRPDPELVASEATETPAAHIGTYALAGPPKRAAHIAGYALAEPGPAAPITHQIQECLDDEV
jgi:hypothetical protein